MKKVTLLIVFMLLFSSGFSFAEVPCKINYQGRLIKDGVPVNGPADMEFKLYTQLTGGTLLKTIPMSSVPVYNGLFRAVLDLEGINWAAGETIYLEVKVGTEILTPREEIYAYPYAINTRFLEGKAKDYFINTSTDTQRKDGGLNIMGNVGIGTTSPAAKLHIGGAAGTDGIMFPDGSLQTSAPRGFGDWVDMTAAASGGAVQGPAATDGFVLVTSGQNNHVWGYTGPSATSLVERIRHQVSSSGSGLGGFTMPVRKGEYWKLGAYYVGQISKVYWISLGK